jgi:transposase
MSAREQLDTLSRDDLIALVLQLQQRLAQLEARLKQNSNNSDKPPSQESPFQPRAKRPLTKRNSGGQPGHDGKGLSKVEAPDQIVDHAPTTCQHCGYDLAQEPAQPAGTWQVFDLPADLKLVVTQHQRHKATCPWCQQESLAALPDWLARETPCQYGPRCRALGLYLMGQQHLPFERTQAVFVDLFGSCPSQGTLWNWQQQAHQRLAPVEAAIADALVASAIAGADETPVRGVAGLNWIHVFCNQAWTWLGAHAKRGREAMDSFGLLGRFTQAGGVLMSDCLASYAIYGKARALCNAHLLRELRAVEEAGHTWATSMVRLLLSVKERVEACGAPLARCALESIGRWFGRCLALGERENAASFVGKSLCLLSRLRARRDEYLRFASVAGVWFDNNVSERALRMVKLHQKVSGCFRSRLGAQVLCRVRGYLSTMKKQGQGLFVALVSVMEGRPLLPPLLTQNN